MATKPPTQSISPVAPPESSLQQFMRLQSTFAPKPIAPPSIPITTGIDENFFNSAPELAPPQRMEAAPYQHDIQAGQIPQPQRPVSLMPRSPSITASPGLTPQRQIPLPQSLGDEDILNEFRRTVLNPPQREHMTYPASMLGSLDAAFKIAATPTDYEKNRVYIDGNAYQQAKQYTDPVTGEVKYINKYKQPGFMEQVLKAVPAGLPGAIDVMNQPHEDAVNDWKLRVEGLQKGAQAEASAALAGQRQAQAAAIPMNALSRRMDSETKARVAMMRDLPDSVRQQMVLDGRASNIEAQQAGALQRAQLGATTQRDIAILRNMNAIELREMIGDQAMEQLERRGVIESGQITQRGQIESGHITQRGQIESGHITQRGQLTAEQIDQRGRIEREIAAQRAKDAIALKAAPGGPGQSQSQQKIALHGRISRIINDMPDAATYITFNDQGFPVIDANNKLDLESRAHLYRLIYEESPGATAFGTPQVPPTPSGFGGQAPPAAPNVNPAQAPQGAAPVQQPAIPPAAGGPSGGAGAIMMLAPDKKSQRMVKAADIQTALDQGYTHISGR